jgi:hypothetical protein
MAFLGPREMCDLRPQSGPKGLLVKRAAVLSEMSTATSRHREGQRSRCHPRRCRH